MRRRSFIKSGGLAGTAVVLGGLRLPLAGPWSGTAPVSTVFEARGGTVEQNVRTVLASFGGLAKIIGADDVVLVKVNGQWVQHGGSNTDVLRVLIGDVLALPGFRGEVVLVENNQRTDPNASPSMWTASGSELQYNGTVNFTQLVAAFNTSGHPNVSLVKLRRVADPGGRLTTGPADGPGYVRSVGEVYAPPANGRRWGYQLAGNGQTFLTWPIFDSPYSGRRIDLRYGIWENGGYSGRPLRLLSVPTLNHHGDYCGVTSALKHFMGIVELPKGPSGEGYDGTFANGYSTFHTIGTPAMGGALGMFLRDVRRPDLTIVGAEWVGYEGRPPYTPVRANAITASTDPCALDQYGAKRILLPWGGSKVALNNPDGSDSRLGAMLDLALAELNRDGVKFTRDESRFHVSSVDLGASLGVRVTRTPTGASLAWDGTVPNNGFLVYRGLRPDLVTVLAELPADASAYVDPTATGNAVYFYRVDRRHGPLV